MNKPLFPLFLLLVVLSSCTVQKRIDKIAGKCLLKDSALATAHVGIVLYNPADKKFVYNHDGEKYFVPASNTKLLTCYAAMKYLGDSLVGLKYDADSTGNLIIHGTGDPTFLHPDFKNQPVYDFLKNNASKKCVLFLGSFSDNPLGMGWSWDDYNEDYAAERSEFPIYGNVARFYLQGDTVAVSPPLFSSLGYGFFSVDNSLRLTNKHNSIEPFKRFTIKRENFETNFFSLSPSKNIFSKVEIPFKTDIAPFDTQHKNNIAHGGKNSIKYIPQTLLEDTLHKKFELSLLKNIDASSIIHKIIRSQPTDSLLKIMMHRSDNFFAEQTLLMVSNELLGVMNDRKIIDTLLKTDYKDLPQKPYWVDGSGLSHYNLVTPQDEVKVLEKMKTNFEWKRITSILPTGGEGTLRIRYKKYIGKIYAKTGSLNGVIALSGFITTNKKHNYIFSVMVNNHVADETEVRDKIEKFITEMMEKF